MPWHKAIARDAVEPDDVVGVTIEGTPIAIVRLGDAYFATHDICTHAFAHLSDGFVEDGCLECPLHQGRFDVRTGAAQGTPVTTPVKTYPVKIEDDHVYVALD